MRLINSNTFFLPQNFIPGCLLCSLKLSSCVYTANIPLILQFTAHLDCSGGKYLWLESRQLRVEM